MSDSFLAILSRVQRLGPVSSETLARTFGGSSWDFNCMDLLLFRTQWQDELLDIRLGCVRGSGSGVRKGVRLHNEAKTFGARHQTLKVDRPKRRQSSSHLQDHLISLHLFEASFRQDGRNVHYCRSPDWLSLGMSALSLCRRSSSIFFFHDQLVSGCTLKARTMIC